MIDWIIGLAGILFGGGISWLVFWKQSKSKLDGEAKQAQAQAQQMSAQAALEWLEVYERSIKQSKEELEDRKQYIDELKNQRQELRKDRDELRKLNEDLHRRLLELDEKVLQLEHDVARNGRIVEGMRHLLCGRLDCKDRVEVATANKTSASKRRKNGTDENQ